MNDRFDHFLQAIDAKALSTCFSFGLEKEALRVTSEGRIAQTPHSSLFGSALTHPMITTDFAESQIELITPVFSTIDAALEHLKQLQGWVSGKLQEHHEMLWALSMPPDIESAEDIAIASYGESEEGRRKEAYRRGLEMRYGKIIQVICGAHYNFSFTDTFFTAVMRHASVNLHERNAAYMNMVRNFLRYRFILVYLFGASPYAGKGYPHDNTSTPHATSLRMSHYGYSNTAERNIFVSFDSVEEYVADLRRAVSTEDPQYSALGLQINGQQVQLNTNILQAPEEYYGPIRIKPKKSTGHLLDDLLDSGIGRVEVRAMDLCPKTSMGVCREELHFLHLFLLYCFFLERPSLSKEERQCANRSQTLVALQGRDPHLRIECDGKSVTIAEKSREVFADLSLMAKALDEKRGTDCYSACVSYYQDALVHMDIDAISLVRSMEEQGLDHHAYGLLLSRNNAEELSAVSVSQDLASRLESLSLCTDV